MNRDRVVAATVIAIALIALGAIWTGLGRPVQEQSANMRVVAGPVKNAPHPQASAREIYDIADQKEYLETPVAARPTPERVARIVAQFAAQPIPLPRPGYVSEATLREKFSREGRTSRSDRATDDLQTVFREVPSLDRELMVQGIECRETLCRMVGSFDPSAQSDGIASAMRGLQISAEDRLHEAGFAQAMIGFSGGNYIAYYRISPLRR